MTDRARRRDRESERMEINLKKEMKNQKTKIIHTFLGNTSHKISK